MKYLMLSYIIIQLLSCNHGEHTARPGETQTALHPNQQMTFYDSVSQEMSLSIDQIRAHTGLDSFYYSGFNSDATFSGDTVLRFPGGVIGVIIRYSDGKVCSKEILFAFQDGAQVATDFEEIDIQCDRELSSDYFYSNYTILADSTIEMKTYFMPPEKEERDDTSKLSETIRYKVNSKGTIDTIFLKKYDD